MNVLLLGNTGQLGWELQRTLQPLGDLCALDHPQINMADPESIRMTVQNCRPDLIVNATAYTDVDKAESEPELSDAINGLGPGVLAEETRKLNAFLIHYSTDYVFDGTKTALYSEADLPRPLNVYGKTKLSGEQAIQSVGCDYMIFRTACVYSLRRESFVSKVMGWARKNELLRIVDDQVSNPTWARMLAEITSQVIARGDNYLRERSGLYHLAGGGYASRYDWALEILRLDPARQEQILTQLLPAKTSEFPTQAQRPLFSALECQKFMQVFELALPPWKAALALAMAF